MRIDAHQHFWRYAPDTHAWIDGSMAALRRDFRPPDLEPLLRAAGFDGCVAVQAQQDVAETEWLLALAGEHSFIRGVVGWVDLRAEEVRQQLRRLSSDTNLKGVRHIVQSEPDDRFMLRPEFMRGIAALEEFGLAYDILIYVRQLPAAAELAAAFPGQRFVLDHIAKPEIRERRIDDWARGIEALARHRNVSCKLSGMVTEADWNAWSPDDIAPYIDVVLESFGPERLMIGSDWPVCTLAGAYGDVLQVVTERIARLATQEQVAILGENAAQFYRL
ncbi:MAG: amidohydrolase family protein [Chloroflexi bacterium]|nr:amidohydrolase family protein [Chloroflexota bacterium]